MPLITAAACTVDAAPPATAEPTTVTVVPTADSDVTTATGGALQITSVPATAARVVTLRKTTGMAMVGLSSMQRHVAFGKGLWHAFVAALRMNTAVAAGAQNVVARKAMLYDEGEGDDDEGESAGTARNSVRATIGSPAAVDRGQEQLRLGNVASFGVAQLPAATETPRLLSPAPAAVVLVVACGCARRCKDEDGSLGAASAINDKNHEIVRVAPAALSVAPAAVTDVSGVAQRDKLKGWRKHVSSAGAVRYNAW